ncbi:hypothetical protein LTR17_002601 [Elasticomyces elasticus]|nr:hypothetical protein LTR17_002601 [Elasticomyces elasticus]
MAKHKQPAAQPTGDDTSVKKPRRQYPAGSYRAHVDLWFRTERREELQARWNFDFEAYKKSYKSEEQLKEESLRESIREDVRAEMAPGLEQMKAAQSEIDTVRKEMVAFFEQAEKDAQGPSKVLVKKGLKGDWQVPCTYDNHLYTYLKKEGSLERLSRRRSMAVCLYDYLTAIW